MIVKIIYIISILLFFLVLPLQAQKQGQELIDSLLKELPKAVDDTNHVKLLKNLSSNLFTSDPDKGIKYGLEGAELAEELSWEKGLAGSYLALGVNYSFGKSDYPKGISYFEKALHIYEKLNLESDIASTLGNLGFVYRNQSDYVRALKYYQRSLKIFEKLKKREGIAANLGNIGIIYDYQSNFPLALEYYKKALVLNKELKNKSGVAALLTNIGLVYYFQGDYNNALDNLKKSQKIFEDMGSRSGTASTLGNIGLIYQTKSDYSQALENYNKAATIYEKLGIKANLANNWGNIGELYYTIAQDSVLRNIKEETEFVSLDKNVDIERSISYYNKAIKLLEEIGELDTRSRFMEGLSKVYAYKGDYEKALNIYKNYIKLKDSVFNQKTKTQIANLEAIRGNEVRDRELKIKDLKIEQSESQRLAAIAGAVVFIFIALLIFRQRRKSEKLLLNILPSKIAKRLKKKERLIADDIESASIVFIDLVGFTAFSKDKKASEVLQMLNDVFNKVDELITKIWVGKNQDYWRWLYGGSGGTRALS